MKKVLKIAGRMSTVKYLYVTAPFIALTAGYITGHYSTVIQNVL